MASAAARERLAKALVWRRGPEGGGCRAWSACQTFLNTEDTEEGRAEVWASGASRCDSAALVVAVVDLGP